MTGTASDSHVQQGRACGDHWTFSIGQCVDHISGDRQGIVIERSRTEKGREVYCLWSIYDDDGRIKHLLAEVLSAVIEGGATCRTCPHWVGRCTA